MPITEMVVTVAIAAAMVLGFIAVLRLFGTMITHKTIRTAVEKDPQAAEPLLAQLTAPRKADGDDRLALILVAIGVAMVGAGLIAVDDPGLIRAVVGAALFPLLVGGTLWVRSRMIERGRRRESGQ
ncbi:MAG TPA: hypothetical protein VNR68_00905 [Sphingomicrobium sp.]|nr:hypothetical protein [Sphingomicrobium sp.]